MDEPFLKSKGHCTTCDQDVEFVSYQTWLRDNFFCSNCGSIPRHRALMHVIETYCPNWRNLVVHESSPDKGGASQKLAKECSRYYPSQYLPEYESGSLIDGVQSENLESLSFPDNSIDLHVTQDVLEHVFNPEKVFGEIARTLRYGGMHICTVPLVRKNKPSRLRARIVNNEIEYIEPAIYHGNPIADGRSLVTVDWGFDICRHIFEDSGLFSQIIYR
jgi:SAM-dependent methyltransferase